MRTRYTLDDLGYDLPERALLAFARHLPADSATASELSDDAGWSRTDMLLARLIEAAELQLWVDVCKGLKKGNRPPRPARIPRPGVKADEHERRIGSGPIPIEEFDDWYYGGEPDG